MKISIIMPSYNQGQFVEAALASVFAQDYSNWEIVFVDGGSTDDTIARVAPHRARLTHCISEPDGGQSDAMGKGFSRASGDLLTWLNTDDLLLPGALSEVVRASKADPECEWFLGNVMWMDAAGHILRCRRGEAYSPLWPRLGLLTAGGPSAFFTPALYGRVGGLNPDLHYQMDTELWWRFILSGARFRRLETYIWALRLHGEAKTSGHYFRDEDAPRSKAVAAAQTCEAAHVSGLRAGHQIAIGSRARQLAARAQKALSPAFLRSVGESHRWHGRTVEEVMGG